MVQQWRLSASTTVHGHMCTIIPLLILWFTWTVRNDVKHRIKRFKAEVIIWKTIQHIQILYHTRLLKHNHWKGDRNLAKLLEYRFHIPLETTPILVHWLFPSLGWLELNTDGAAKANPGIAGARCIIRDHTGSLRPTFYEFLGEQTNVYA
ncbi:UNVERIFIED_CONTAM: hypothetical protein Sradi_4095800 [Sesamum radiatum]|uniref:RNase H type-1 domain-containing protein n=1 Tax=Sesamum radiatum TaxID=300843 RepID=A0AAW2P426_SESRA